MEKCLQEVFEKYILDYSPDARTFYLVGEREPKSLIKTEALIPYNLTKEQLKTFLCSRSELRFEAFPYTENINKTVVPVN